MASLSELTTAADITVNDLIEVATPDQGSATGYVTGKDILGNVADAFLNEFTQAQLQTSDQTVVGAINEVAEKAATVYSTTEQTIGQWVDGKPLYRKTFVVTTPGSETSTEIDTSGLNIDTLVYIFGMFNSGTGTGSFEAPIPYVEPYDLQNSSINVFYLHDDSKIYVRKSSANMALASFHLTVDYTKTTDTPPTP